MKGEFDVDSAHSTARFLDGLRQCFKGGIRRLRTADNCFLTFELTVPLAVPDTLSTEARFTAYAGFLVFQGTWITLWNTGYRFIWCRSGYGVIPRTTRVWDLTRNIHLLFEGITVGVSFPIECVGIPNCVLSCSAWTLAPWNIFCSKSHNRKKSKWESNKWLRPRTGIRSSYSWTIGSSFMNKERTKMPHKHSIIIDLAHLNWDLLNHSRERDNEYLRHTHKSSGRMEPNRVLP